MTSALKKKAMTAVAVVFLMITAALSAGCRGAARETAEPVETRLFTDSAGRRVEVPVTIDRIAVSGPLAQMYLFALCPDRLAGISSGWSDEALLYIDDKYADLPEIGHLYGSKGDLNVETLMDIGAQIIIDVGESKESIREDMDDLEEQTGIPAVHITATLKTAGEAFRMLGDLLSLPDEAEELASFCERVCARSERIASSVDKVPLLYLDGDLGQNVMAKGSFHSEVVDLLSDNLADVGSASGKGLGNEVDMEQILTWDPEVILFAPQSYFDYVDEDSAWEEIAAVRNDRYYEVPFGPYNWMGTPPSCQRYLGMMWMESLLYPEACDYDLREEVRAYYRLFYHTDLTDELYDGLVADSIGKAAR